MLLLLVAVAVAVAVTVDVARCFTVAVAFGVLCFGDDVDSILLLHVSCCF